MFETFYGLSATPFTRVVPPADLFRPEQFLECLARLSYLVRTRGFGLLTGEVGSGKTTALRALTHSFDSSSHQVLYISQSGLTPRHLYRELCLQMGLSPPYQVADCRRLLQHTFLDAYKNHGRHPVVIIDEGHLLSPVMLEEIRFFTNFQMDAVSPMTLILAGQTELKARLKLQSFEAITQRITLQHHLSGLSGLETKGYIEHHLKVAGAHRPLFSDDAIQLIYQFSKGIPRKINNLCTACLLDGFLEEKSVVDVATVRKALQEFEDD